MQGRTGMVEWFSALCCGTVGSWVRALAQAIGSGRGSELDATNAC